MPPSYTNPGPDARGSARPAHLSKVGYAGGNGNSDDVLSHEGFWV